MGVPKIDHNSDEWLNMVCPMCGKRFHLKTCAISKAKRHFCSRECFYKAKVDDMSGENNHQYGLLGEKNASWMGGRRITNYGYIYVNVPEHPFGHKKSHLVFEHRLIAEKYLLTEENSIEINGKRYLKPEYDVHHIDHDRRNNDVSNLQVLTRKEHQMLHNKENYRERDEKGRFMKGKDVHVRKITKNATIPTKATEGSAGYDMYAQLDEPLVIPPYTGKMIKSGIALSIPDGYAGFIFARSGLSTKKGLRPSTCVSVIDSDYRGEIGLPIYNDSDEPQTINPNERIAQIVFLKVLKPEIEIVDSLDETDRGESGFGSSGR